MNDLSKKLAHAGYRARREELLAVSGALSRNDGARCLLLEGPPGCGKTALAEAVSSATEAQYVYSLLHSWSDDQELFCGVSVAAAVAGDSDQVLQPGVLAQAATLSQTNDLVVLCLDEIDKAPERVEALLLDFLSSGRVPVKPGVQIQARLSSLLVMLTSNDNRPLSEALLRRCRRVRMAPLPSDVEIELVVARSGVKPGVAKLLVKAAAAVRGMGETTPALQEIVNAAADLSVCESAADVRATLEGWLCKSPEEFKATKPYAAPIWGELQVGNN